VTDDITTNKIVDSVKKIGDFKFEMWQTMFFIKWMRNDLHEITRKLNDEERKLLKKIPKIAKKDNKEIMKLFYDRFYSADVIKLCVLAKGTMILSNK